MWIEVVSRHGEIAARERIEAGEARIGRAFDNDVVVDDPHVAPHHVRIFRGEDGELVAEDLSSINGLYAEHGKDRAQRLSLASNPGLRIGRTTLRVHDAAHPVPAEKALTPPRAHAAWDAALGVALLALLLLFEWLDLTAEPRANALLLPLLGFVTVIVLWSGLWALLSRVFFGQARFALQLRIALTACVALIVWEQASSTLSFGFAWRSLADYAGLGAWALLAATCYAHLRSIGPRHMRIAMGALLALIVAGAGMQFAGKSESHRLFGDRATLGDLRPPSFRLRGVASTTDFLRRTETVRHSVDLARLREPPSIASPADTDTD